MKHRAQPIVPFSQSDGVRHIDERRLKPGFAGRWRTDIRGCLRERPQPVRGVLDRPSAGGSWNLALDETEPFYIGGSMKRLDISRAVHGLAERRRGRSRATDATRSTGL